jgi:hypothetical protein
MRRETTPSRTLPTSRTLPRSRELVRPCACGRPAMRYVTSDGPKTAPYCQTCARSGDPAHS